MKLPAGAYTRPSSRPMMGLPEPTNPLQDHDIMVAVCGRICMHRKKINIPTVRTVSSFAIKERRSLARLTDYDLGWISTWGRARHETVTQSRGQTVLRDNRYRCLRAEHLEKLERAKGFEPSTPTLARSCSTPELHPHPIAGGRLPGRQSADLCQMRPANATARYLRVVPDPSPSQGYASDRMRILEFGASEVCEKAGYREGMREPGRNPAIFSSTVARWPDGLVPPIAK